MPIWDLEPHLIVGRLDRNQFRFLVAPGMEPYWAILVELYRARKQELMFELPLETLHERVLPQMERYRSPAAFELSDLRTVLNQLVDWGNIEMRLEPRRIRRIQDRGLERYLVRLTKTTDAILARLEGLLEEMESSEVASARFSLLEVDDALEEVMAFLRKRTERSDEETSRAGRHLARARRAVEEAGDELLRLDLWLSETAVQHPDRDRLAELLNQVETYFQRYLSEVDERRQKCHEKLQKLMSRASRDFLERIRQSLQREFEEDPTRQGGQALDPTRLLEQVNEFLEPEGTLDQRRRDIHERLADVAGHLRRHLDEILRRSRLLEQLQTLSSRLLRAGVNGGITSDLERFFLELWQPAHGVFDELGGTPSERAEPPLPPRYRPCTKPRFAAASVQPAPARGPVPARPTILAKLEALNDFVQEQILRGQSQAHVRDAVLEDFNHVGMLVEAVRLARTRKSRLRQQYLDFHVVLNSGSPRSVLVPKDESGRLTLPSMTFLAGAGHGN